MPTRLIPDARVYNDSWLTTLGKGALATKNAIDDYLIDPARTYLLGENPNILAQIAEGAGSISGYILAGKLFGLPALKPLAAASILGGLEASSEAGSFLADAYKRGQFGDEALKKAGWNLLTNAGLNIGLDYFLSPFGKIAGGVTGGEVTNPYFRRVVQRINSIKNPYLRKLARGSIIGGSEVLNELFQEPSQQLIGEASTNALNNDVGYWGELGRLLPTWPKRFVELAPTVGASTALSMVLFGLAGMPGT